MAKKDVQKKRMMKYFIEAAEQIIESEGVDKLTIRKVADLAGYNSATLYNYFENIEHLTFYAYMKYLKDYALTLQNEFNTSESGLKKFLSIWNMFSSRSFEHPLIYYTLFFTKYSDQFNDAVQTYYDIFPENLGSPPEEVMPMMMERNIYERDFKALELCAKEGYLNYDDLYEINEMIMLMYQSILLRLMHDEMGCSAEEAVERLMKYINVVLKSYLIRNE